MIQERIRDEDALRKAGADIIVPDLKLVEIEELL
jgi:hypothetical protein